MMMIRRKYQDSNVSPLKHEQQPHINRRRLLEQTTAHSSIFSPKRLLYIVTSMNEYDTGRRATTKGYDRFQNTVLPVVQESMTSMWQWQWLQQQQQLSSEEDALHLHLYFVAHYNVTRTELLQQLVHRVSSQTSHQQQRITFQVWHQATPMGYAYDNNQQPSRISEITRGLARQQRYIVKDSFQDYDMVVAFEDDMLVTGSALEHYWTWTQQLYQGRRGAPKRANYSKSEALTRFHGDMTLTQWQRMIPGFMRVEAPLANFVPTTNNLYEQIPLNYLYDDNNHTTVQHIDPSLCCHASWDENVTRIPSHPKDLYFWETSIDVLGIRQLPTKEWVLLLAGNNDALYPQPEYIIGDYYPNDWYNHTPRPDKTKSRYMSNQGGWMGTRHQIIEWHSHWCPGGYLPPFLAPYHKFDGLHLQSVEYWSGGGQLVGPHACHLQRIIPLEPTQFSRSLLYHTSNNKQRSHNVRHRFSSRTVDEFWAQLNSIRQRAVRVLQEVEAEQRQ